MEHPLPTAPTKIVVTGPFGAGKTTLVTTLSGIPGVSTETGVSDGTAVVKTRTTVALDHGTVTATPPVGAAWPQQRVALFGTPGQDRFSFMWEMLSTDMAGYVVVVDASTTTSVVQARDIAATFARLAPEVPRVVAVNRWAEPDRTRTHLARALGAPADALVECDPRDLADCTTALHHLLDRIPHPRPGEHGPRP
jgi:uncharacterized protein